MISNKIDNQKERIYTNDDIINEKEKKDMKKTILIIIVLIICVGAICMIKTNITDTNDVLSNEDEFNQDDNINNSTSKNSFEIVEVQENDFKNNYKVEEQFEIINKAYFNVEKEDKFITITLIESSQNEELLKNNEKITFNQKYTISNVNAEDVSQIFCGCEGQDLIYPVVYLLLKDETVKGIDIENGYNTAEFKAETIFGLNNIEKIEQTSVTIPDDSGYEAVVAITEDETAYEIRKK